MMAILRFYANRARKMRLALRWLCAQCGHERTVVLALRATIAPIVFLCMTAVGCAEPLRAPEGIALHRPTGANRMLDVERIVDGRAPSDGAAWDHELASRGQAPGAFVDFDLGKKTRIRAAWIQADNNDRYALGASEDGKSYQAIWVAPAVSDPGLRTRYSNALDVETRYIRLAPIEGDGVFSVTELILYSQTPQEWPPAIAREQPAPPNQPIRHQIAYAAFALVALLYFTSRRTRWLAVGFLAIPVIALCFEVVRAVWLAWPIDIVTESAFRCAAAAVTAAAVARLLLVSWPAHRTLALSIVGAMAIVSAASFFHFGHRQFYDQKNARPSFIHNYDMRVYFPTAKYFRELGFNGLYVGSIAALLADQKDLSVEQLAGVPLRDLTTHRLVRVADVANDIQSFHERFSESRWRNFVRDMRYFRDSLGVQDYLRTELDHGANATPLWLANAHLLFAGVHASNGVLFATSLLDPLLLAICFFAIARSFGIPSALVSLVVFGANDFHVGGNTNWVGATLRHDWLAMLALGICALKARRPALAGALLACAGFLRAFPAFALFGIVATTAWALVERRRHDGRWPSIRVFANERRDAVRALGASAVASVAFFGFSCIVLTFGAWGQWLNKVRVLSQDAHPNHMSLRTLFSRDVANSLRMADARALPLDWQAGELAAFKSHAVLFYIAATLATVLIVWTCRRQPLERAAIIGLLLFVVWLYPANYYLHFVFLLPLLADVPRGVRFFYLSPGACFLWLCPLALCTLQFAAFLEAYSDDHYFHSTLMSLIAFLLIVAATNEDIVDWTRHRLARMARKRLAPRAA